MKYFYLLTTVNNYKMYVYPLFVIQSNNQTPHRNLNIYKSAQVVISHSHSEVKLSG